MKKHHTNEFQELGSLFDNLRNELINVEEDKILIIPDNQGKRRIERLSKNDKLVISAAEIGMNTSTIKDADFIHSLLCQVGLPRKQTFVLDSFGNKILDENGKRIEAREFERTSGNSSLLIKAGEFWNGKEWVKQPLPYGSIPRLTMVYIVSEAIKTKENIINIGDSLTSFMHSLGIDKSGGKTGRYRYVKEQIKSLAVCELRLGMAHQEQSLNVNMNPITEFKAWLSNDENQRVFWPGQVTLSENFFKSIQVHAVPLDSRALKELSDSALALDIYFWLAHRLYRAKPDGELIRWQALKNQFGQEYKNLFHFKEEFKNKLNQVITQYPGARVELDYTEGIIIFESPPPIQKKTHYLIK